MAADNGVADALTASWKRLFQDWSRNANMEDNLREMERLVLLDGVPAAYRGEVWMTISGAQARRAAQVSLYETLRGRVLPIEVTELIDLDARRLGSLSEGSVHELADDTAIAKAVAITRCFCAWDSDLGYVQGMLYIVLLLVVVLETEDKAFWLLVTLMDSYSLRNFLHPRSSSLFDTLQELDTQIRTQLPVLHRHLVDQQCYPAMYAVECFTCLFVTSLPYTTVVRIWDLLLMRHPRIVVETMVSIMTLLERELLTATTDTIFATLRQGMAALSADNLLPLVLAPAPAEPVCAVS